MGKNGTLNTNKSYANPNLSKSSSSHFTSLKQKTKKQKFDMREDDEKEAKNTGDEGVFVFIFSFFEICL